MRSTVSAVRADSTLVYTNLVPTGAFRGFGNPSADWAVEQAWDLAAEKLGIDILDLLRMNAMEPGGVSPHNHKVTSCELKQCIDKAAGMIRWSEKRKEKAALGPSPPTPLPRKKKKKKKKKKRQRTSALCFPHAGWASAAACTSTAAAASATGMAARNRAAERGRPCHRHHR